MTVILLIRTCKYHTFVSISFLFVTGFIFCNNPKCNGTLALAFCQGGSRAMLTSMMANEKHIFPVALYWPSLLIPLPTMAQLITCQASLVEGISFLIWKPGAPKRRRKTEEKNRTAHRKLQSMNCHTTSKWERAIWPARLRYITLQWQLDPIMAEHFSEPVS